MARRSQCSSTGDNPLDPNYLPPHYREEYRLAIDALVEEDLEGYYRFLQKADVVDFLSTPEIQHIQSSVQSPQQSGYPEHQFREVGEDGSSDTYWPLHTDLDVPGLDLGWPQTHHLIGPTEVTTLVNPPEPNMPSIKEQARRLIKNAQQVIAIVMDTFTDVDIFADILNAAMRNVAIYIILDEQNAPHFIDMVSNCRVNLHNMQFLRVRTVPGITYQCRSGKSFKGQLMDRFLLTDCRAVLSGNYSFMWSFEKLNRCMAHLFLGQLVATFDEEFRILFAQSQPLIIENMVGQIEDLGPSQKRQYPSERISLYREPKTFLDSGHSDEWGRHSYDERMEGDWRRYPLKKPEAPCGPLDMYNRFPSQQPRMEQNFDHGPSRIPMMENPPFKRHSFAEGVQGRYQYQFLQQQGLPDSDLQGRYSMRGQQSYPGPGQEADYSGADKFWNQDNLSGDQYSELQQMQPPDNFDPVLNYLSSTRALDMDQSSDKQQGRDVGPPHIRRPSLSQPYTYQTSPTPSNPSEQKHLFQEPNTARKDPSVKRGLRNWRISSYLSAYDNPEDDGMPMSTPQGPDPFEEPSYHLQETAIGNQLSLPKIPNVREFKVPAIPRASQMPSYAKTLTQEEPKILLDEPTLVPVETKTTPTPSESSNTTESEKMDEVDQKEPKLSALRREDSFRRTYNAAQPRASRLRYSRIFQSLDQQNTPQDAKTTNPDQQDEESDKGESEQPKVPFLSQVLGQRRLTRESFEWSRYLKSSSLDNSSTDSSKPETRDTEEADKDNTDSSKDETLRPLSENSKVQESPKLPGVVQDNLSPIVSQSKRSDDERLSQPMQPPPFLSPLLDFDLDAYNRLRFFKELAAKQKAEKAVEANKSKEKALASSASAQREITPIKTETPVPKKSTEKQASTSGDIIEKHATTDSTRNTVSTETQKTLPPSLEIRETLIKQTSFDNNDLIMSQGCNARQTKVTADSQKSELESAEIMPKTEAGQSKSSEKQSPVCLTAQRSETCPLPSSTVASNTSTIVQAIETSSHDPTFEDRKSVCLSSFAEPESSIVNSISQKSKLIREETICLPALKSEQDDQSACNTSKITHLSCTLDNTSNVMCETPISITSPTNSQNSASSSQQLFSQLTEGTANDISLGECSDSDPNSSLLQPISNMSGEQVFDATLSAKEKTLNLVKQKEAISNCVKDAVPEKVSSSVKNVNELEKSALKSVTDAVVYMSVTNSVKQLPESEDSATCSEKTHNIFEGASKLEKCVFENRVDSDLNETVPELGKETFKTEQVSRSEIHGSSSIVTEISEDPEPSSVLSLQTVDSSASKLETVCPVDMTSDKLNEATTSVTRSPVIEVVTHDGTQVEKITLAKDSLRLQTSPSVFTASVGKNITSGETVPYMCPQSSKTSSENMSPCLESSIANDKHGDSKPNITSMQSPAEMSALTLIDVKISERGSQNDNLESDKDTADSVEDVTELEKDVLIIDKETTLSDTLSSLEKDIIVSEKVFDSEKDNCVQEQMGSDLGEIGSESGEEVIELRQISNSDNASCPMPVSKDTLDSSCSNPAVLDSELHIVEISTSKDDDLAENVSAVHRFADTQPQISPSETSSPVITNIIPKSSQSENTPPPQGPLRKMNPSSDFVIPVCNAPNFGETASCLSPHSESDGSVLSPEAKIAETSMSPVHSVPDTMSLSNEANNPQKPMSTKIPSCPPEPNSNVQVENNPLFKKTEPMTSENSTQEPIVLTENGKTDKTQEGKPYTKDTDGGTIDSEKTNDQIKNHSPEQADIIARHPKLSQSRYHSSTANVLSSSNLRDDTKLLLGQISANSQCRNERNKDSPVTDDEKEDKEDKNAQKEKYTALRTLDKGPPKSTQERDKLLERIQSMRKERKVYSRFEL